ncbi:hypothetical protein HG535_0F04160 [Zygotorulaspora mrakii]|uniref:Kinase n=1 Tax=Zygotorulaspora mrakii TaxID=42260 RepID=A0A7H9B6G1_ZYGMR|nr:uncharacterized protein HG535_0F04160 [Zygotorulaspora mrakii]QLG73904.1 hypothetical protein HG535_0F04160 [Zygotorulaspora mrakii]
MGEFKLLRHKAAGHEGTLTDKDEVLVFKVLTQQELDFYQVVQEKSLRESDAADAADGDLPLSAWLPTFLGVLDESLQERGPGDSTAILSDSQTTPKSGGRKLLVLENLLYGYSQPNVLDVKLGKILFDEHASEEKRQRLSEVSRTTTSGSSGFRICGMHMQANELTKEIDEVHFEETDTGNIFINKNFGRSRTVDNIEGAFNLFFANDRLSEKRIKQLKEIFLQRIQLLYNTLLDEEVRMVSASLLFIYEGDPNRWDTLEDHDPILRSDFIEYSEDNESVEGEYEGKNRDYKGEEDSNDSMPENTSLSTLALIDFAHSKFVPGEGYDENVVDAVENLMKLFDNLNL